MTKASELVKMPPRASRWLRLMRWLGLAPLPSTCVWCPGCSNEMMTCPDTECRECLTWLPGGQEGDGVVEYTCAVCSVVSVWDFSAPVPLLLAETEAK